MGFFIKIVNLIALRLLLIYLITLSQQVFAEQLPSATKNISMQQHLTVGADDWPDYAAVDGSGIYFTLIKEIFPDYKIDYKIKPLNETFNDFKQQKLDIVVGAYKHELNKALYPQWFLDTEYPLLAFYNKKSPNITSASDLISLKPAWLSTYDFAKLIPGKLAPIKVSSVDAGFDLITHNKADFFIDYPYNIPKKLLNKLDSIEILPPQHVYAAFQHNQNGRKLAREFDLKMASLRSTGRLAHLFDKAYAATDLGNYVIDKEKIIIYTNSVSLLNEQSRQNQKIDESTTLRFIFNLLKGYKVEYRPFNNISEIYQHPEEDNVCFSDLIITPKREKNFTISKPFSLFLGLRLYSEKPISTSSSVNLEALLNSNRTLKLGTVSGRSYGNNIDDILSKIKSFQLIKSPVDIETLFKQFAKKRFDLLIEYPSFKAKNWSQEAKEKLYSYNIEGADNAILGHMMCSKSEKGQKFVEKFNLVLEKFYRSGYFFNAQYQRILPENKEMFIHYFNETFN